LVSKGEEMPREDIKKIQEQKLRMQVKYVFNNSAFYHRKFVDAGLDPSHIKSLEDLSKIPVTTREEVLSSFSDGDPFGGRLCVPVDKLWYIILPHEAALSGKPFYTAYTYNDRRVLMDQLTRFFRMIGVGIKDLVMISGQSWELTPRVLESAFTIEETVQDRLGFINMPLEASLSFLDVPRAIYLGEQLKPRIFFSLVSYFDQVTQEIKRQQKKPKDVFHPEVVVLREVPDDIQLAAEKKEEYKNEWGSAIFKMLDIQDIAFLSMECPEHTGLHAWEDMFIVEASSGGKPAAAGKKGKLTITNLWSEATPLIRYQTQYEVSLDKNQCKCGGNHLRIKT
jgi:phenylacetate-CoA ligase